MSPAKILLFCILLSLLYTANAQDQNLYNYQDLSHVYYQKQKDSLKKAWVCPSAFSDRDGQHKYKEIYDSRTEFLLSAITHDDYVHDREVYPYIAGIVRQIANANRGLIPADPLLLLDRNPSVNAYALGDNVLAVNLGLVIFSGSREELALAIAHEMSHNILHHPENAMRERAAWLSSDEYKQSLNAVLSSRYDRLTRLQKILEGFTFSRSRHQRFHESEADSLAIILLKNCNITFNAKYFLHLDSADEEYHQHLHQPLRNYFTTYQLPFDDSWATRHSHGLSTRNYNFSDTTTLEDSLKTHPDCPERYARTKDRSAAHPQLTPIPQSVKDRTNKMLIWNLYTSGTLTPCLYRIFLEKDKGSKDPWYDFMISNIFYGLYYADRNLNRFNAIGIVQKEYISKDYYSLQTLFEQMPRESLRQYCEGFGAGAFWSSLPSPEHGLKSLLYTLALDPDDSERARSKAAHAFATDNAGSMYCEFSDNFEKK
ncbi:MAG TPA: M48 family metalloprotease [Puia sp.]|jgi:Zn-dependent protease with chaperone function|nr:M48 family metalloprotease [Puia sp.]